MVKVRIYKEDLRRGRERKGQKYIHEGLKTSKTRGE